MHLERAIRILEWNRLHRERVSADRDHAEAREVARACHSEAGVLQLHVGRIAQRLLLPARVKDHHVARSDCYAFALRRGVDLSAVVGRAGGQRLDTVQRRHVEQHAARRDGRHAVGAEFEQAARRHEFLRFEAVVVAVIDAEMTEAVEL